MDPTSLRLSGAVPLDNLAAPRPPAAAPPVSGMSGDAPAAVVDVTEASFENDVIRRSAQVPVVVDFWAEWCGPCKQLSPILEKIAAESGGSWVLAKIDVDANPRLAQAAQVQGIPAVKAIVNGQVVGEFTGALPEAQVRQWIEQLVQAARGGTFGPLAGAPKAVGADGEVPVDPDLAAADEALFNGDLDASEAAYRRLGERPGVSPELKAEARGGVARVGLLRRSEALDPAALQAAVDADPADLAATLGLADALVLSERASDAFDLLLNFVRTNADDARDAARVRLLGLFEVLGDGDPLVPAARRKLAAALF